MTKPGSGSLNPDPAIGPWTVEFHDDFDPEFDAMAEDVQDGLLAAAKAIQMLGPHAGRPYVDTLKGSRHANMKELRFEGHDGNEEWRAAFAFDPDRRGIILVAGDKQGRNSARFYRKLIAKADERFESHLGRIAKARRDRQE